MELAPPQSSKMGSKGYPKLPDPDDGLISSYPGNPLRRNLFNLADSRLTSSSFNVGATAGKGEAPIGSMSLNYNTFGPGAGSINYKKGQITPPGSNSLTCPGSASLRLRKGSVTPPGAGSLSKSETNSETKLVVPKLRSGNNEANNNGTGTSSMTSSYADANRALNATKENDFDTKSQTSITTELLDQIRSASMCFNKDTGDKDSVELSNLKKKIKGGPVSLQYTLETFTEARSTSWAYEPFMGQPVDGSNNGPAPGPWDVPIQFPEKFRDNSTCLEVPHTASVKPCHECATIGRIRCYRCHGRGRVICHHCDGSGRETYYEDGTNHQRSCTWCHGSGRNRCAICFGHGQVPCKTCEAKGQLKCYIKLTVEWTNHVADHIVERTALPDKLIKRVSGQVAFEEELPRVWPINHFPDDAINKASNDLVNQHTTSFPSERIIVQRQRVRIVPVAETSFIYKDKPARNFYIYGLEKKVHAPDYPATCCWGGCTII